MISECIVNCSVRKEYRWCDENETTIHCESPDSRLREDAATPRAPTFRPLWRPSAGVPRTRCHIGQSDLADGTKSSLRSRGARVRVRLDGFDRRSYRANQSDHFFVP